MTEQLLCARPVGGLEFILKAFGASLRAAKLGLTDKISVANASVRKIAIGCSKSR